MRDHRIARNQLNKEIAESSKHYANLLTDHSAVTGPAEILAHLEKLARLYDFDQKGLWEFVKIEFSPYIAEQRRGLLGEITKYYRDDYVTIEDELDHWRKDKSDIFEYIRVTEVDWNGNSDFKVPLPNRFNAIIKRVNMKFR